MCHDTPCHRVAVREDEPAQEWAFPRRAAVRGLTVAGTSPIQTGPRNKGRRESR
jgi:hypothetical protein